MLIPLLVGDGTDTIDIISIDGVSAGVDYPVDVFIDELVPEFVSVDHSTFVDFLKAYYQWMQVEGNTKYQQQELIDLHDVDRTSSGFLQYFQNQYLSSFPKTLESSTDIRKVIKSIVDTYKVKGTEKSYRTIFRVLFNEEPEFYYPNKDILRLSDGNWVEPKIVKTTQTNSLSDIFNMVGRQITHRNPSTREILSYGFVETVKPIFKSGYQYLEIEVSGIFGEFTPESYIECELASGTVITEYIYPGVSEISIESGGTGYNLTDQVDVSGGFGKNFQGQITDVSQEGVIRSINVLNSGVNYRLNDELTVTISSNGGAGASLGISGGVGIDSRKGIYVGNDGLISTNKKMQDNNFYQDFSYVVRSSQNLEDYRDILIRLLHPAGMKLFSEGLLKELSSLSSSITDATQAYEVPLAGHYTPYLFNTIRNLRANGTGGVGSTYPGIDLYPSGYGYSAAAGGSFAPEFGTTFQHDPYGAPGGWSTGAGPLGGYTHGAGTTIWNTPQGEQYAVENGWISGGASGASPDYWFIYPHPTWRGATSMPNTGIGTIKDLVLYNNDDFPSSDGWTIGEIVTQTNTFSQDAVGVILSHSFFGDNKVLTVASIGGGQFLDFYTEIAGGTVGRCIGASGSSAYINNVNNSSTSSHSLDTPFKYIRIEDFVTGLKKDFN